MAKGKLFLFMALFTAAAFAKDKPAMPAVVTNARYVMVTTYDGDLLNPQVLPDDREAVSNVQNALDKWGRYKLVFNPGEAELLIVVRTGRVVEAHASVQVGRGPGRPSGVGVGAQNGDPQDTLDIYDAQRGTESVPLWRGRAAGGLKAPELQLFKEFRAKVEAAAKKP